MIDETILIKDIKKFLGKEGLDYLQKSKSEGNFELAWGSMLYGRVGMLVRNYIRANHPDIDKEFKDYGKFEDYTHDLMIKILENYV